MAVAGEEQGLYGSTYFAKQAAEQKMQIEAMFTNDIVGGVTTYKNAPDRANDTRLCRGCTVERDRGRGEGNATAWAARTTAPRGSLAATSKRWPISIRPVSR